MNLSQSTNKKVNIMKKIIILSISILFLSFSINAQERKNIETPAKLNYSLELGAGIANFNGNNIFYSYTAPQINYLLKENIIVNAGIIVLNSNFNKNSDFCQNAQSPVYAYYFAGITYSVNENFSVNGKIIHSVAGINNKYENKKFMPDSYSVGAKYKFNKNFAVGVQFSNYNNYNEMFSNPFYGF